MALSVLLYVITNIKLYAKLLHEVENLREKNINSEADIKPVVRKKDFTQSGQAHPKSGGYSQGYTASGLPVGGTLWLNMNLENRGKTKGILEIVEIQAVMPMPFSSVPQFYDDRTGWIGPIDLKTARWECHFDIAEEDPIEFARQLHDISGKQYRLDITYHTRRVGDPSPDETLSITGDFEGFYKDVIEHWESYNFPELAKIATR